MEIDGDGHLDILSGSYSRMQQEMAGLFQVLRGKADGTFRRAEVLKGTDGEPLIIPTKGPEEMTEKICTRPYAERQAWRGQGHPGRVGRPDRRSTPPRTRRPIHV